MTGTTVPMFAAKALDARKHRTSAIFRSFMTGGLYANPLRLATFDMLVFTYFYTGRNPLFAITSRDHQKGDRACLSWFSTELAARLWLRAWTLRIRRKRGAWVFWAATP